MAVGNRRRLNSFPMARIERRRHFRKFGLERLQQAQLSQKRLLLVRTGTQLNLCRSDVRRLRKDHRRRQRRAEMLEVMNQEVAKPVGLTNLKRLIKPDRLFLDRFGECENFEN